MASVNAGSSAHGQGVLLVCTMVIGGKKIKGVSVLKKNRKF